MHILQGQLQFIKYFSACKDQERWEILKSYIYEELKKKREYEARVEALVVLLQRKRGTESEMAIQIELDNCRCQLASIKIWRSLLTEEEEFVIRRHLIDRASWSRVVEEYSAAYGVNSCLSQRTLKNREDQAIRRIEQFHQSIGNFG